MFIPTVVMIGFILCFMPDGEVANLGYQKVVRISDGIGIEC